MKSPAPLRYGIDVGGTKIALGLVSGDGRMVAFRRLRTPQPAEPEGLAAALASHLASLLAEAGADLRQVEAVGMGFPADFDPSGVVLTAPNLPGFVGLDPRQLLASALERHLDYRGPVAVGNDASAAARAEGRWGAGRGQDSFLYLTISTGIGGARFERSAEGIRAVNLEPGKNTFPDPERPNECLDRLASGAALARRVREELATLLETQGATALAEKTRLLGASVLPVPEALRRLEALTAQDLGLGAAAGDDFSHRWLTHSADLVAISLGKLLAEAVDRGKPFHRIVVGGSIALKAPGYLERLRLSLDGVLAPPETAGFQTRRGLVAAELGDVSGSLGATLLAGPPAA